MKYIKLEYDMNRPFTKQVGVPLNSEYGVAVEVYRNGGKLPLVSSDISVGGYIGETVNGLACFQLSSGSEPCRTEYDVSVEKKWNSQISAKTSTGSILLAPGEMTQLALQTGVTGAVSPSDIGKWWCEVTGPSGVERYSFFGDNRFQTQVNRHYYYVNSDGKWESLKTGATADTLNFSNQRLTFILVSNEPAPAAFDYVQHVEPPEDVDGKFKLVVQEKDVGYFEIPRFEPEPEPDPDPVEINGYYGDYSDSTVYSSDAIIEESLTLPAVAVM